MTIAAIRITGMVGVDKDVEETLSRLRLRRKYACTLLKDSEESKKILQKIRNFIAYGKITDEILKELISKRAQSMPGKKIDVEKVMKEARAGRIESAKPFFRLHPPRGGANTKIHFPKGILGDNGVEMNKLILRML